MLRSGAGWAVSGTMAADALDLEPLIGAPPPLIAGDGGWSKAPALAGARGGPRPRPARVGDARDVARPGDRQSRGGGVAAGRPVRRQAARRRLRPWGAERGVLYRREAGLLRDPADADAGERRFRRAADRFRRAPFRRPGQRQGQRCAPAAARPPRSSPAPTARRRWRSPTAGSATSISRRRCGAGSGG